VELLQFAWTKFTLRFMHIISLCMNCTTWVVESIRWHFRRLDHPFLCGIYTRGLLCMCKVVVIGAELVLPQITIHHPFASLWVSECCLYVGNAPHLLATRF
jgi:hypothetical protein